MDDSTRIDDTQLETSEATQMDERLEGVSGGDGSVLVCPNCGSYRYVYRQSVGGLICLDCDYTIW